MFAYCENNPITNIDSTGKSLTVVITGFIIGIIGISITPQEVLEDAGQTVGELASTIANSSAEAISYLTNKKIQLKLKQSSQRIQ